MSTNLEDIKNDLRKTYQAFGTYSPLIASFELSIGGDIVDSKKFIGEPEINEEAIKIKWEKDNPEEAKKKKEEQEIKQKEMIEKLKNESYEKMLSITEFTFLINDVQIKIEKIDKTNITQPILISERFQSEEIKEIVFNFKKGTYNWWMMYREFENKGTFTIPKTTNIINLDKYGIQYCTYHPVKKVELTKDEFGYQIKMILDSKELKELMNIMEYDF
jgi:hypothetical protein